MTIEIINGIRVIIPSEDCWLYNEEARTISNKVFLGVYADENDWLEITNKRKIELEALWESEG